MSHHAPSQGVAEERAQLGTAAGEALRTRSLALTLGTANVLVVHSTFAARKHA